MRRLVSSAAAAMRAREAASSSCAWALAIAVAASSANAASRCPAPGLSCPGRVVAVISTPHSRPPATTGLPVAARMPAAAQSWTLASDGGCMDITGANYNNGTPIQWYTCWGGANQKWTVQNGQIINHTSGKCLDDPNGSTASGTQLQIWSCSGASNQQWHVP